MKHSVVACMALDAGRHLRAVPRDMSMFETVHAESLFAQFGHLLIGKQGGQDVALLRLVEAVADRALDGRLRLRRRIGDLVGEGRRLLSLTLIGIYRLRRRFDGGNAGSRWV